MKKTLTLLMIGLFLLTACSKKESSDLTYLDKNEYKETLEAKDAYVVVVGRIDCSTCVQFKPVLEEMVANKDLQLFYIQIDNSKWNDADKDELRAFVKESYDYELAFTPTLFVVKDGEMLEVEVGYMEYGALLELLEDHGFVKS